MTHRWIMGLLLIAVCLAVPLIVFAAATATSVALSASANCDNGAIDIGLNSSGASREGGIASVEGGVLVNFEQATTLSNFNGVYNGFGFAFSNPVPAGTIIGLYGYVGNTPPDADTAEYFVVYNCTTGEVTFTCFGAGGTCPQSVNTIQEPVSADACRNPLPSGYVVRSVPAGALAYFAPNMDSYTGFNLPQGTWYVGAADGDFVPVWIACEANRIFIPTANVAG